MDSRIFERIDGNLNVRYSQVLPENSEEFFTESKNLSGGGIRLSLNRGFKKGDTVRLRISVPFSSKIEVRGFGRIVWLWENTETFDAGVEFMNQDLLQVGRLYSYLESQIRNRF